LHFFAQAQKIRNCNIEPNLRQKLTDNSYAYTAIDNPNHCLRSWRSSVLHYDAYNHGTD